MRSPDRCVSAALAVLKVSIRLHFGDKFQSGVKPLVPDDLRSVN
nr:hypothetical protein [Mesorhizobium sp.]